MPLFLDTALAGSASELRAANCVTIGFINNMPDSALEATERQFIGLVRSAASRTVVRVKLYTIPDVPRGEAAWRTLDGRYQDIAELWNASLDGLIVTGTEPRSRDLKDEPYWATLARVVDWARDHTGSTVWSCLAAHAAVLHADGIERVPLAEKAYGVFDCEAVASHPMTSDAAQGLRVPHSRLNGLPERALAASGYRILTRSAAVGVDMFVRQEKNFQLFLQGHPEYEASTLLREHRRDVARFLRGERESYPLLPQGYFDADATAVAVSFQQRAMIDRNEDLVADFPMRELESRLESPWRRCAVGIYEKWLEYLSGRKAERRPPPPLLRRAWRDWPSPAGRQEAGVE